MPRLGLDPIFTGEDDPTLADFSFGDAVGAMAQSTFRRDMPTFGALRTFELEAEAGAPTTIETVMGGTAVGGLAASIRQAFYGRPSPVLSKQQAQDKLAAQGLTGKIDVAEAGITERALDLLMEYKRDELDNAFVLESYKGGIAANVGLFGVGFLTATADPLNIASAFVPVVGEARYAAMLQRAGTSLGARASVRAGVGAVEGTVGAAMLEPTLYWTNQQLQADYTTMDSLLNVGFGAVFGGVLQPGFGGVADLYAKRMGIGQWAETINPDGLREIPDAPPGFIGGGGTRFVDGDDYVRGQWQIADASTLSRPAAEAFGDVDPTQVATSPYSASGAPVLRPDGGVDGNRRLAAILDAYANGRAENYRAEVLAQAERLGFDARQLESIANPVLVRRESAREVGRWGEERALVEQSPAYRLSPTEIENNFRRWFGESKVVDADGRPLVVYHGSPVGGIEQFNVSRNGSYGPGIYVTPNPGVAGWYSNQATPTGTQANPTVYPVYVNIKNPIPLDLFSKLSDSFASDDLRTEILRLGYDGVIDFDNGEIVAFNPEQVKSATGNSGKFDPDSPSLTDPIEGRPTPMQAEAALRIGVTQAVNGKTVDVSAVRELDGTPQGVERFLEARRIAEESEAAAVAEHEAAIARAIAEGDRVKVEDEVAKLEADLRAEMRATGMDEAELDAVLEEVRLLEDDYKAEEAALRGIGFCMSRNA